MLDIPSLDTALRVEEKSAAAVAKVRNTVSARLRPRGTGRAPRHARRATRNCGGRPRCQPGQRGPAVEALRQPSGRVRHHEKMPTASQTNLSREARNERAQECLLTRARERAGDADREPRDGGKPGGSRPGAARASPGSHPGVTRTPPGRYPGAAPRGPRDPGARDAARRPASRACGATSVGTYVATYVRGVAGSACPCAPPGPGLRPLRVQRAHSNRPGQVLAVRVSVWWRPWTALRGV